MKNKIEVETIVKELVQKEDGNYIYINLYQKAIVCDTKTKVFKQLVEQSKGAKKFVTENIKGGKIE